MVRILINVIGLLGAYLRWYEACLGPCVSVLATSEYFSVGKSPITVRCHITVCLMKVTVVRLTVSCHV